MNALFLAGFMTGVLFFFNIREDRRRPFHQYVALFLFFAGINFLLLPSKGHADLFNQTYLVRTKDGIKIETDDKRKNKLVPDSLHEVNKQFMLDCHKMMIYHFEEGCKSLKEAEKVIWWFPDVTEQDKALMCWTQIPAVLVPNEPKYRIMSAVLLAVGQYGTMIMTEWQHFDAKLQQAKMHFEMEEFYKIAGKRMQDELNLEKKK